MAYTLSNKCAKNCCKRTILVQVIIEDVVTCFFGTQCSKNFRPSLHRVVCAIFPQNCHRYIRSTTNLSSKQVGVFIKVKVR